ncbi:MAG: MlaD family protein [Verrucomicrobiales bacterium]
MPKPEKRTETLVGAFLLFGLLTLTYLIAQFGQLGDLLRGSYELSVVFQEASGVIKGSAVRLGGTKIGQVKTEPELTPDARARVTLAIDEDIKLPANSVFQITTAGFLGDKEIIVTPPDSLGREHIEPGSELQGGGPGGLELLQSEAEAIVSDARVLMKDARAAMLKMDHALSEISGVATRLGDGIDTINRDVLSTENLANLQKSLAHFEKSTRELGQLRQDLQPLLAESQTTLQSIRKAADSADATFQDARSEIARLEPTLEKMPAAVDSITRSADEASATLSQIREGEGLLGTLTDNKEVKTDTETFLKNLRKYGILRYRDAETAAENDPRDRFRGKRR